MGRLINGTWKTENELTEKDLERDVTTFRGRISNASQISPESGRYHLYISRACPWAHGPVLVRKLLGLEETISMDIVDPYREDKGWKFSPKKSGCTSDSLHDSDFLHEVYTAANSSFTGNVTVPVLWDKYEETIVSNESLDIMEMFATAFKECSCNVDIYPNNLCDNINSVVEDIQESLNSGVYSVGFANSQTTYERAVMNLFEALDHYEEVLGEQRFLVGDKLTIADLRLFPTLVRFDIVYHTHFKCDIRRLVDYPNLWGYTRDIFQIEGISETVNTDHIKNHYYRSHTDINPKQIVSLGPDIDFARPHERGELSRAEFPY